MNIPGIFKIEKIECSLVDLPLIPNIQTIDLDDYLSGSLSEIEFINETPGIRVVERETDAGVVFEVEIPFAIAGYDQNTLADLDHTARKPHLFVITEKTGTKYLVGFSYNPRAKFSFDLKNDPNGQGGRSLQCRITWNTPLFPVFVE